MTDEQVDLGPGESSLDRLLMAQAIDRALVSLEVAASHSAAMAAAGLLSVFTIEAGKLGVRLSEDAAARLSHIDAVDLLQDLSLALRSAGGGDRAVAPSLGGEATATVLPAP